MPLSVLFRQLAAAVAVLLSTGLAEAAELVMVERAGCIWCERWERDIGPAYMRSDEGQRAPLRRVSLDHGQPRLTLKEPVRFTPTFILIEQDREVGRITGYLDNAMFWGLLGVLIAKLDQPPAKE